MCDNAMTYNRPDTVYYKLAKKILHAGFKMMSKVRNPLRAGEEPRPERPPALLVPNEKLTANDTLPSVCPWPRRGPLPSGCPCHALQVPVLQAPPSLCSCPS